MAKKPQAVDEPAKGKHHRATYARDKKNGGYLVNVEGPTPNLFVGRTVPVETVDGKVTSETLTALITSSQHTGKMSSISGKPWALYKFVQKPREAANDVEF